MNTEKHADRDLTITYVIIACLPVAVGLRYATDGMSMLALLMLSFYSAFTLRSPVQRLFLDLQLPMIAILMGTTLFAWVTGAFLTRTVEANELIFLLVILITTFFIWYRLRTLTHEQLLSCIWALFDGLGIYIVSNVIGYLIGMQSPSVSQRDPAIAALKFIDEYRVVFPLGHGLSIAPIMAAAYCASYPFLRRSASKVPKVVSSLRLVAFAASIFVIVASGARNPAAAALLIFAASSLLPRLTVNLVGPISVFALFVPLWWPLFGGLLVAPIAEVGQSISFFGSRTDRITSREDIASLTNRTEVWDAVFESTQHSSLPHLLFGYGAEGQIPSGVSRETAYLFAQLRDPGRASTHSTLLQQFIDQGLVGALLLLTVFCLAAGHVSKTYRAAGSVQAQSCATACGVLLAVFAVSGSTDRALGPGLLTDPFWIFVLAALIWSEYHTRSAIPAAAGGTSRTSRNSSRIPRWSAGTARIHSFGQQGG